jgi:Tfp pilus assembly protein PilN
VSFGRWAGWEAWRPALMLSAAGAVLVAIAAIGLTWQNAAMESTLEGLTRDQRKLAPIAQKFTEMERSIRSDRKYLEAAKVLDQSALPLEALNRVSAALPDNYWIQHLQFKGDTLDLVGRGGGNDEVIRLLGKKGIEAAPPPNDPGSAVRAGTDGFNLRLDLNKLSSGGGR